MTHHDLDWLLEQRPEPIALDSGTTARAREELVRYALDPGQARSPTRVRPSLRRALRVASVGAIGAAAIVTALVVAVAPPAPRMHVRQVTAGTTSGRHASRSAHRGVAGVVGGRSAAAKPLVRLADYISNASAPPGGDATLVLRTQQYPNQPTSTGADLYTDSGKYYYAPTQAGLPAAIAAGDIGDGFMQRELTAARFAANGNIDVARQRMAIAALDPKIAAESPAQRRQQAIDELSSALKPATDPAQRAAIQARLDAIEQRHVEAQPQTDNEIWENSLDALVAGAGDPQVRAGILRLLATVNTVTVAQSSTAGQPSLTLTATGDAMPANYQEQLVINADTGLPIQFTGGVPGQAPGVTVTYQVSRVTVAEIAAGH